MKRLYGKINSVDDISKINCIIRDEMLVVETEEQLTELKKRSDYLCTLTYSPFWKKKFAPIIENLKDRAFIENRITVQLANYIAKYKNYDKHYDAWGDDNETVDEKLDNLPEEVIKKLQIYIENINLSFEVLEDIRKSYCSIRAGMPFVDDKDELVELKKQSDLLVALSKTNDFIKRFEEKIDLIEEFIEKEEKRTIKLANIIASVNDWKIEFINWDYDFIKDEDSLDGYIDSLLNEEKKSDIYLPSEGKYTYGARIIYVAYKHPKRNRIYAKRIYIPETAKNITITGPSIFENRFGKKVYGIKLDYDVFVKETKIIKDNVEITLPARWVKKYKIVKLPENVENIKITEEKPKEAYPVA